MQPEPQPISTAWLSLAVVCFAIFCTASAQEPSLGIAEERLKVATDTSSLDAVSSRPWHLRMEVTSFDSDGANPQQGSVDVWRSGEDSKTMFDFGASKEAQLQSGGKHYVSSSGSPVPEVARELLRQVLHPGPGPADLSGTVPQLSHEKLGQEALDCIILTPVKPVKAPSDVPVGLYPSYCLTANTNFLRAYYNFGAMTALRLQSGEFLGCTVSMKLALIDGKTEVGKGTVSKLSTFEPSSDEFLPSDSMKPVNGDRVMLATGLAAARIIEKVQPVYPVSARTAHIGGSVVMRAIISREGTVRALEVKSTNQRDLTIAAVSAVKHWRYVPATQNGVPIEIDTTITVNFNMSPG